MDEQLNQAQTLLQDSAAKGRQIEIDFDALIDLISHHLYKDKSAVIRELLSNANDALIARKRETDFEDASPMIRLWLDQQAKRLTVKDNGIGMSETDLVDYLSVIGASLTRKYRNAYLDEKLSIATDEFIGRFGVGFLSSFIVADKIVVETRKLNHPGCRWESRGKRDYTIVEKPDMDYGTTVLLDLKHEVYKDWNDETIRKMVRENARNFVFPIYWGPEGEEKLNDLQAPWYTEKPPSDDKLEEFRSFLAKYDDRFGGADSALEIIPLYSEDIRGVVYIPALATIKHDKIGVVDLYCKRVFVTKEDSDIVPRVFGFIKGVVDCFSFRLTAARDEVLRDDYNYERVRRFIETQIMERLRYLAERAAEKLEKEDSDMPLSKTERYNLRLQTIMDQYHLAIKHALVEKRSERVFFYDDHYLTDFDDFMPFQSSMHPTVTLPEYFSRMDASGRSHEILLLRTNEDVAAQRAITEKEKREFIVVRYPVEEDYLRRYSQIIGVPCVYAAEMLKDAFVKLPTTDGWDKIIRYYQDRLSHFEISLSVYLSEFQPETVPGRIFADKESAGLTRWQEVFKELEQNRAIDKDDPLFKELEKLKQRRPHFLFINKNNPTLAKLTDMLAKGVDFDPDIILHQIFHDILLAGGHQIGEGHLSEYQTKAYGEMLTGIEAKQERKNVEAKLSEERKRHNDAQAELAVLRHKLEEITPQVAHAPQPTTNDVFFVRPIKEGQDPYDWIASKAEEICKKFGLRLVDPKAIRVPGNILEEILNYLRNSKLVIADISEIENPNIYYEVGYVYGAFPNKLILIADKKVIHQEKLPFDIRVQRVLGYNMAFVPEFDEFLKHLENYIKNTLEKYKD